MKNTQLKFSALVLSFWALGSAGAMADGYDRHHETLYTLSNDAANNEVLAYQWNERGTMQASAQYPTGGVGTGQGLGNQGALALSPNQQFLFAVNAGSNDVSVFRIDGAGLTLVDRVAETGKTPVSITASHDWVYVVNSGDDSIFGYRFNPASGKLTAVAASYRKLASTGSGAAQISFDADQDALVVTEKAVNQISSFTLGHNGLPQAMHSINSAGHTPFGFAFGKHNQLFVSEAQGGAANASTVSSYKLAEDGGLQVIDSALATGKTAACWLATTPNGRLAFTADTPANTISSFSIANNGQLTVIQSAAATENHPTDLAVSLDGSMLYTLSGGDNAIGIYTIGGNGALSKQSSVAGLPAGVTGLIVR
jgi:6-phosphogluconolactonase